MELKKKELTQKRLKEVLDYNSNTGEFFWKESMGNRGAGAPAGSINSCGYRLISIDCRRLPGHQWAWLYVYGYFPENEIDHINRNRLDNRIENLREASRSCNRRNSCVPRNCTTGVKGVGWDKWSGKWAARIYDQQKNIRIGRYKDFSEAVCARLAAEQCLNWAWCDSSSSAYQYVQKFLKHI